MFASEARFVVQPQLRRQAFERVARASQLGLGRATHRQCGLQCHVQRIGRQGVEFHARLLQARFVGADFLMDLRNAVRQLLDFIVAGRQRKAGFLMAALGRALQFARFEHRTVGLVALLPGLV